MGMYLLIVNIALRLDRPFYKLVAIGFGTEYAFQVFLTIGGTTKFIPMTGITLPLVSYGGSSLMCTIAMISIIQGLYIMRKDEDEELEEERRERIRRNRELQRQPQNRDQGFRPQQPFRPEEHYEQQPYRPHGQSGQVRQYTGDLERKIEEQTKEDLALRNH